MHAVELGRVVWLGGLGSRLSGLICTHSSPLTQLAEPLLEWDWNAEGGVCVGGFLDGEGTIERWMVWRPYGQDRQKYSTSVIVLKLLFKAP